MACITNMTGCVQEEKGWKMTYFSGYFVELMLEKMLNTYSSEYMNDW